MLRKSPPDSRRSDRGPTEASSRTRLITELSFVLPSHPLGWDRPVDKEWPVDDQRDTPYKDRLTVQWIGATSLRARKPFS